VCVPSTETPADTVVATRLGDLSRVASHAVTEPADTIVRQILDEAQGDVTMAILADELDALWTRGRWTVADIAQVCAEAVSDLVGRTGNEADTH